MQTKLILNLTALRNGGEREITTLLILSTFLTRAGFTWEDGTRGPRNLDADAIVVNHPKFESPNVLATYRNGSFNEALQAKVKAEPDTTVFDASHPRELELFILGVKYLAKLNEHREQTALEDAVIDDHLARPLGWSGSNGLDPVFTEDMEGVRMSVCQHGVVMTADKTKVGVPDAAKTRRLVARSQTIAREKFGLLV